MLVHLNIGLASEAYGIVAANSVLQVLANHGFFIRSSETIDSDTEPTLVVVADWGLNTHCKPGGALDEACYKVAELAGQDCLAALLPEWRQGRLIGPRASAWGEFNPELFFLLDGSRLAAQRAAA